MRYVNFWKMNYMQVLVVCVVNMEKVYILLTNDNGVITIDKKYYKDFDKAKSVFKDKVYKLCDSVFMKVFKIEINTDSYFVAKNEYGDIITMMIDILEIGE